MVLKKFDSDLSKIDFLSMLVVDINGNVRSVSLPKGYISQKIFDNGIGFDASNFGYAKVHDSDMVAVPDLSTGFVEEREEFDILHVFCDVKTTEGGAFDQYPRTVSQKALEYLKSTGIGDDMQALVELEFYVFDEVTYSSGLDHSSYQVQSAEGIGPSFDDLPRQGTSKYYHRLSPDDKYLDLRNRVVNLMEAAGIAVKYHHHEVGASQLEIELNFMSITKAADSVVLSKWIIKSVADEMGLSVTFMPKPMYKLAGSGMHVHQYINKKGASIFPGELLYNLSKEGLSYTAGVLEHSLTGSLLAMTNPSTNSYRRLVPGYEAPISATFAKGSRCAAVRIPGYLKKGESRIEFRTGDATANIYYALAAMLLAGIDGIKRNLDPVQLGYNVQGETENNTFPVNLGTVLDGLKIDAAYLLPVFPQKLLDLWIASKKKDAEYVYNAPTPQEYELYY